VARRLGFEAGLFVPSGTMANEIAIRLLTEPGQLVLAEQRSHVIEYELSGMAALSGVAPMAVSASGGMLTPGAPFSLGDLVSHLILPALLLSIGHAALIMRYMRASLLEVLNQDYVRSARAKGVKEFWVVVKHALRNALLPVVTLIGSTIGIAVGGAIFLESVFNWPGMGLLLVNAVETRDYPVIMGATLVVGACVILANLLTDIAYAAIDPRIQVA